MDSGTNEIRDPAQAELARAAKLDAMLKQLKRDREALESKSQQLKDALGKENPDIGRLEDVSLTAVFYRLKNRPGKEHVQPRVEILAEHLKYKQSVKDLEFVTAHIEKLSAERARLPKREEEGPPDGGAAQRERRIARTWARLNDIGEAASSGRDVGSCLEIAERDLDKAEELGAASGGMLSTAVKFEYIHAASSQISDAQRLMYRFRTGLAVVDPDGSQTGIAELGQFVDTFLDCLIGDYFVRGRISDSLECVRTTMERVAAVLSRLEEMAADERESLAALRAGRDAPERH